MAQIASPSRVPFGMIDNSRLKQLTNVKNKQNALSASPSSILSKRKAASDPFASDIDSENVDPSYFSSKKSKLSSGNPLKAGLSSSTPYKPSHFILRTDNTSSLLSQAPSVSTRPIATPRRAHKSPLDLTPRTAPAGRSPQRKKRAGLAGKRRTSAPFARINPPALGGSQSSAMPFSIDAALTGSVPSYQPVKASSSTAAWESKVDSLDSQANRSSWFFEIHEDTPEEELGNLMEFSTQTLDISDGETVEDKRKRELEERGKENIPPGLQGIDIAGATVSPPTSRKDIMSDEPRTPLGELEAKEFYAEGCDEQSVIIVHDDGEVNEDKPTAASVDAEVSVFAEDVVSNEPEVSPIEAKNPNQEAWQELLARVDEQQKALVIDNTEEHPEELLEQAEGPVITEEYYVPEQVPLPPSDDDIWAVEATSREEAPLFDIWESESAKEEAEELDALAVAA